MTIILDNVSKSYDGNIVLDNFRVEIEWGKIYAFVGPTGSGKSTILKIFMGSETPDSGSVARMGDYKYPTLHSAYVSQNGNLNLKRDALWNVVNGNRADGLLGKLGLKNTSKNAGKTGAIKELSKFISEDRLEIPVEDLTLAEQRFVELVRASFCSADFIVLDEPFLGMDENQKKSAIDFILEMRGSRPTLIASKSEDGLDFANKVIHLN